MGAVGAVAHRAQGQPGAGTGEKPRHSDRHRQRQIHQRVMAQQDAARHRAVAQAGDGQLHRRRQRLADETLADQAGGADAEDGQRQPCRGLIGHQRDRQHREQQRHRRPRQRASRHRQHGRAGGERHAKGGDGAHQHHPLKPEVQHAGALRHQLAHGGEQERGGGDHDGNDKRLHRLTPPRRGAGAGASGSACRRPAGRTAASLETRRSRSWAA